MADEIRASDAGEHEARRFGFIAVIGAPNAGKSTLVNALVGAKVTIVSHKVQTTRMPVRGIAIEGASQLVLVDTPGIFAPRRRLDQAMVDAAWSGAREADAVALVVDAARWLDSEIERLLVDLKVMACPKALVLNKVDRLDNKAALLGLATRMSAQTAFDAVFMISALDGGGVGDLKRYLAGKVPEGPWHYPEDDISD